MYPFQRGSDNTFGLWDIREIHFRQPLMVVHIFDSALVQDETDGDDLVESQGNLHLSLPAYRTFELGVGCCFTFITHDHKLAGF